MRRGAAILFVVGAALLGPASAGAATVSIPGGGSTLEIAAPAGEVNLVTIARSGASYIISDAGTPPVAGGGCAPSGPAVTCPVAGITNIDAVLDDLNDSGTVAATVVGDFDVFVTISGEDGVDTLNGGPNIRSTLNGDNDGDFLNGGAKGDSMRGGDGTDVMTGAAGDDFFDGGPGNDSATGGAGKDLFGSESTPDGADTFNGGPDVDEFSYTQRFTPVTADADGVADDGASCPGVGCEADNIGASVEGLRSGNGADTLTGNGLDNHLEGNSGADTLSGLGGVDDIRGGNGVDNLFGGPGADVLRSEDDSDRVFAGSGDDRIFGPFIPDGPDLYSGGGGSDVAFFEGLGNRRVDLDGRADDGFACPGAGCEGDNVRPDIEDLIGGDGRDVFIGSRFANDFSGGLGNDRLVGGGGPDGLLGEDGNDSLTGGGGIDSLIGGSGADRLKSRDRKRDEVSCGSSSDRVTGDRRDHIARDCDRVRRGRRR